MAIMHKDEIIGFRVPAALKRALEAAAEAEHRSLGQLCTLALMQFLEGRGEWPSKDRAGGSGSGRTRNTRRRTTVAVKARR
jgi:hypothetical protein